MARFEAPVHGVVVLDADERGLGVRADFLGGRFLTGDSLLTPRASKMSTSGFPSEGTKMLVYVDECVSWVDHPRTGEGVGQTDTPATVMKARFKSFLALSLAFLDLYEKSSSAQDINGGHTVNEHVLTGSVIWVDRTPVESPNGRASVEHMRAAFRQELGCESSVNEDGIRRILNAETGGGNAQKGNLT